MTAWVALLTTVVGALLTAVLGNRLVQSWQQRNWLHQQQFSGLEREYVALKALTDVLVRDCGGRLAAMRDLVAALRRNAYQEELKAYRLVLATWNGSIHAHYAQLTFQLKWDCTTHLEHHIHDKFVSTGRLIETEIRHQKAGGSVNGGRCGALDQSLDDIAGEIADFSRILVRATEERRQEVFYGRKISYSKSDIVRLGNLDLIKLLFESDIDNFAVVRPTTDVVSPLGRRL
ncbi:hypothetical protein [uncultured Brevundimonas sp.]|uniref:hypothetical protein n=1 Tax=uncultured Brevundimonas sp. TaxID=213418 RepID=UPI0030ED7742